MAWRMHKSVIRGEIDNRNRGFITGAVWLLGRPEPLRLFLSGNALRDIAGSLLTFENPHPEPGDPVNLAESQEGVVGELTASRKVRAFRVPIEKALEMKKAGKEVPEQLSNCLYLEWFSRHNGRVVIESIDFTMSISEPVWRMSEDEEIAQGRANLDAIRDWVDRLSNIDLPDEDDPAEDPAPEDEPLPPMNEFQWEKNLKESDRLTEKYSSLLDKYMDHPNRDQIVAREMGWTWLEDALDAEERGAFEDAEAENTDLIPFEPNPRTEGTDWIRTDSGRITHPLSARAFKVAMDMWHFCEKKGLLKNDRDPDLHEMLFRAQTLSAKLAGALDGLAYEEDIEPGFIIACLKRALKAFNASIDALYRTRPKNLVDADRLELFHTDLFAIREEVLSLMKHYRDKQA